MKLKDANDVTTIRVFFVGRMVKIVKIAAIATLRIIVILANNCH